MNNNLIPNASANKLYVAHSNVKENKLQKNLRRNETEKPNAPKAVTVQFVGRSYYYDSNGGGYQGL